MSKIKNILTNPIVLCVGSGLVGLGLLLLGSSDQNKLVGFALIINAFVAWMAFRF